MPRPERSRRTAIETVFCVVVVSAVTSLWRLRRWPTRRRPGRWERATTYGADEVTVVDDVPFAAPGAAAEHNLMRYRSLHGLHLLRSLRTYPPLLSGEPRPLALRRFQRS